MVRLSEITNDGYAAHLHLFTVLLSCEHGDSTVHGLHMAESTDDTRKIYGGLHYNTFPFRRLSILNIKVRRNSAAPKV